MHRLQTEASYWARQSIRSALINTALAMGVTGAVYGAFKLPYEYKYLSMLAGLTVSVAGVANCKHGSEAELSSNDLRKVSEMARTSRYYEETKPTVTLPELPKPFDWSKLRDLPDQFPHAILIGNSGGGKSSLAENLAGLLKGDTFGVIPHYQVGDFRACRAVWGDENNVGQGADFDRRAFKPRTKLEDWDDMLRAIPVPPGNDPVVTWSEIVEGQVNPTVCQVFRALWFEMRRRYKKGSDGKFIGGNRCNLIVDEFNSLANLPGLRRIWLDLVREARKVSIALILIVQQSDVKSLNIDGQSDILDNLVQICFNKAADERLLQNVNLYGDDSILREFWLSKFKEYQLQHYRATVGNEWAELPKPGAWVSSTAPVDSKVVNENVQSREAPSNLAQVVDEVPSHPTNREKALDIAEDALKSMHEQAVIAANQGWSKNKIITKRWGIKNLSFGCQVWRRIQTEIGDIILLPQQDVKNCEASLQQSSEAVSIEE